MEIMLNDLKLEKQQEILSYLGLNSPKEGNYDVIPLFIISNIHAVENGQYDRLVISLLKMNK